MTFRIKQGDNRDVLKTIEDNSIDAIVTDPPYGIDFLGKEWDANTGALETYQECLRVLKPGGHILAFSAPRTYHHLAITLEQAGFEIRDQIMWIYSSGFPKAQKINGFDGWKNGALKPAHEPIALARKPVKTSIEKNMQKWGVGALNIDPCRIERPGEENRFPSNVIGEIPDYQKYFYCPKVSRAERHIGFDTTNIPTNPDGMWDEGVQFQEKKQGLITSDEMLAKMGGHWLDGNGNQVGSERDGSKMLWLPHTGAIFTHGLKHEYEKWCKANNVALGNVGNNHPTVKPVELMKYLIKLITPPGGTVLDPFSGSGSTGMAAVELGCDYTGIELDPSYVEIAQTRIQAWTERHTTNNFKDLFSATE